MNVLFVHQNYPAQFGTIAAALMHRYRWKCTFVTKWKGQTKIMPMVKYEPVGNTSDGVHFLARNFDNTARSALGVYEAVKKAGLKEKPDVIVGHSGFGSTLLLRDLFDCPVVNLFEFYYRIAARTASYTPKFPIEPRFEQRLRFLNACILLDLQEAAAGYTPTHFQRNQFPKEYLPKIETIFDGVDSHIFRKHTGLPRVIKGRTIPDDVKIVTYVSRGFESMRGYDIFIQAAKRIYAEYPKVLFVCVGSDRVCYGGDNRRISEGSFRAHIENREKPDPDKFFYTGVVPVVELVKILSLSDVHIYFTVPFVLSWSMINAMSCGCNIVSCCTGPVEEVIDHDQNGLLADYHDVEGHAQNALKILRDEAGYARLGTNARRTVEDKYSLNRTLPALMRLLGRVAGKQVWPPPNG
jgi:glycosyltransferase involved in cell wall biosynthesis